MIDDRLLAIARFAQTLGGLCLVGGLTVSATTVRLPGRAIFGASSARALAGAVVWLVRAREQYGAILILIGKPAPSPIPTVLLTGAPPAPGICGARDQAAWAGYAVLADVLSLPDCDWSTVDANGWLRQRGSGAPDASWATWAKIRPTPLTLTDHRHSRSH